MKKVLTVAALALGSSVLSAQAAEPVTGDYYLNYVYSTGEVEDFDGKSEDYTNHRVTLGYWMDSRWALEGSVFSGSANIDKRYGVADYAASVDLSGLSAGGKGLYPLADNWALYGRAGLTYWDGEAKAVVEASGIETQRAKETDSGVDFYLGAGVSYQYDHWHFSLDYERFNALDGTLGLMGAGVGYRF